MSKQLSRYSMKWASLILAKGKPFFIDLVKRLRGAAPRDNRTATTVESDVRSCFTYREAISYFIEHAPDQPVRIRGLLIRQPHPYGLCLIQTFVDEANEPICAPQHGTIPHGRRVVTRSIDAELQDFFADEDHILFE